MAIKPTIFVKGPSGSGKDYSLRHLDPKSTVLLNVEDKPGPYKYPFPSARVKSLNPKTKEKDEAYFVLNFTAMLKKCLENPEMRVIIINSFTSFTERLFTEASKVYSDYDVWSYYNKVITDVLRASKQTEDKYVVWTGLDENIVGQNGIEANTIAVQGKVWSGKVAKEFTIVLQTHVQENQNGVEYQFITNRVAGFTRSDIKSPPGLLPDRMPNDLRTVIDLCDTIYSDDEESIDLKEENPSSSAGESADNAQ
jgi:hypothetical protein